MYRIAVNYVNQYKYVRIAYNVLFNDSMIPSMYRIVDSHIECCSSTIVVIPAKPLYNSDIV